MGCGPSTDEEDDLNTSVGSDLLNDKKAAKKAKKLLFLGSGGSGKSTLFKQLRTIHGEGFTDKDRVGFRDHIYSQILEQMKQLVESTEFLKEDFPKKYGDLTYSEKGSKSAQEIENARGDLDINDEIAAHIIILWKEPLIQGVFNERQMYKIDDSTAYFFDQVKRISYRSYIPTDKDILMVRHRTTGVIEQKFQVSKTMFHIFDVGGQKSERRKWIHCFENVTGVLFVASLSSYNEVLYEDDSVNSMHDSLDLFDHICNLNWFINTSMILFLNKSDLFQDLIQNVPLTVCFENYEGTENYDECVGFITKQFENRNRSEDKEIYSHTTCATDKNNVEKVFADVQHIIVKKSLVNGGLV